MADLLKLMGYIVKMLKLGGCIFAFLGIVVLIVSIFVSIHTYHVVTTYEQTTGIIVDYVRDFSHESEPIYYPVIEYQVDGVSYTEVSNVGYSFKRSGTMEILYDKDNPESIAIKSGLMLLPPIFVFLGFIFTAVGVVFIILPARIVSWMDESMKISPQMGLDANANDSEGGNQ